jgi:hypothetical protein
MTHINAGDGTAVLVRAADAEVIGFLRRRSGCWPIAPRPAGG